MKAKPLSSHTISVEKTHEDLWYAFVATNLMKTFQILKTLNDRIFNREICVAHAQSHMNCMWEVKSNYTHACWISFLNYYMNIRWNKMAQKSLQCSQNITTSTVCDNHLNEAQQVQTLPFCTDWMYCRSARECTNVLRYNSTGNITTLTSWLCSRKWLSTISYMLVSKVGSPVGMYLAIACTQNTTSQLYRAAFWSKKE